MRVTVEEKEARYAGWPDRVKHARLVRSGISSLLLPEEDAAARESARYRRRYAVNVACLQAVDLKRVEGSADGLRVPLGSAHAGEAPLIGLYARLEKVAVRALYTLGLDSGEVVLASSGERKFGVERVTPSSGIKDPRIKARYDRAETELARRLRREEEEGIRLVMGMDPEFVLVDAGSNEMVPASRFLDREGEVGCDAVHGEGFTTFPIAELRPDPSGDPTGLLKRLMFTMQAAGRMIGDRSLIWQAGGMPRPGLPLGGHLHFSGIVLTPELLRALDNYLTLPVSLLEDENSRARRPKYGYLGDFRRQPHGGFEYRTLPSFLVSPLLAKGVVYLSYLIVSHYRELKMRPLDASERVHRAYYRGDREVLKPAVRPLLGEIRRLPDYGNYAGSIEPLLAHIERGTTWNESRDIRPLWNIPVEP